MTFSDHIMRTSSHAPHMVPSLGAELIELAASLRALFDPYRPERHYMRGPGPKWRAKHGVPEARSIPAPNLFSSFCVLAHIRWTRMGSSSTCRCQS